MCLASCGTTCTESEDKIVFNNKVCQKNIKPIMSVLDNEDILYACVVNSTLKQLDDLGLQFCPVATRGITQKKKKNNSFLSKKKLNLNYYVCQFKI